MGTKLIHENSGSDSKWSRNEENTVDEMEKESDPTEKKIMANKRRCKVFSGFVAKKSRAVAIVFAMLSEKIDNANARFILPAAVASAMIRASGTESIDSSRIINLPKFPTGRVPGARRDRMNQAMRTAMINPDEASKEYKAASPASCNVEAVSAIKGDAWGPAVGENDESPKKNRIDQTWRTRKLASTTSRRGRARLPLTALRTQCVHTQD